MNKLIYVIPPIDHNKESLLEIITSHPQIKFVSLMGVDLGGNATEEKIPIEEFGNNIKSFLKSGIQTDGSSVVLHDIAVLNNARVDLVPDLSVNWFVDYNYDHIYEGTNLPVGTLKIPSFLVHNGKKVDSRSILMKATDHFKDSIKKILKKNSEFLNKIDIKNYDDIDEILLTAATELELWVKTPDDKANIEELSTSQRLKEQYWKRTVGTVRTALEKSIILLEKYGFEPEMGHKEVGGVTSKIGISGKTNYVMEQLEIDWKYSDPIQAGDNEIIIRELVEDVFTYHGLEVTFEAKPLAGVAGSGEHTHVGVSVRLKDGTIKNLFSPKDMEKDYLNEFGYGALMGILKNYEVINPFITSLNNAFKRLKPGFEAPVCIVTSLGESANNPTRNRSVLVGVIRDLENRLATRFEVRSPNPLSNTYLVIATIYQGILDGILAVVNSNKNIKELEKEISKKPGEEGFYLEKSRQYRSEENVFEYYSEEKRNEVFGYHPSTVWENLKNLDLYVEKINVLLRGDVFTKEIIHSFKLSTLDRWIMELRNRILLDNMELLRSCVKLHDNEDVTDLDVVMWEKIHGLKLYLMKNSLDRKSLFTKIKDALDNKNYELASNLQLEMDGKIMELRNLYDEYSKNLF
ncbi:glutamine synthetase [Dethiothermospora halolimnae]|uniref:glutamine synthetase n=1 Tax=Dethiothermospora halolimnae TaxID=3114390 RepID=UPI003CCBB3AD